MRLSENRIIKLKEFIQSRKTVTVEEISKTFDISEVTARRDLARLKKDGFIIKVHGGAVLRELGHLEAEPVFEDRLSQHKQEKTSIAREAAKRIKNGSIFIIESGSTCFHLLQFLADKENLKIATCGIPIANELIRMVRIKKDFEINVSGGLARPDSQVYTGPSTVEFFNSINAELCFISALGVSAEKGISTDNYFDAAVSRKIIEVSDRAILLCDSSKFGKSSYVKIAPLEDIDEIITDGGVPGSLIESYKSKGTRLTVV